MDPALAILDRALKGDVGALSFLERTASIYVFDGTNPGQPKICGAWDFLSQALTELERYEDRVSNSVLPPGSVFPNLEGHVQLLATMSRRAAKRSPVSDQKLVEICLTNASYRGSTEQAHHLINYNDQLRKREMGRLAAMVFDFSYHRSTTGHAGHQQQGIIYQSAFSNPVAMESLCAVVAANAISIGPQELVNLVSEWIVPSLDNLPPYAVASVTCHLAGEAMGKSAPAGIADALNSQLFQPVISKVLAPMLQEAVRESDHDGTVTGGRIKNQRIASMALKALERWSAATACSLVHISQVCQNSNVNIIAILSDTMYSDSEMIMDALAEFLETLLLKPSQYESLIKGIGIAGKIMNNQMHNPMSHNAAPLQNLEEALNGEIFKRRAFLSELLSAIGLQRFRFNDRLANGDTGVCRSLTSIARSIAAASQTDIKAGHFQGSERGFIDLLMKSVRHPSIHVCAIALEAIMLILTPKSDIATHLLPMLQGKAIVPPFLVGLVTNDECDVDFNEFERFREHLLSEILISCYISNRAYYIESCTCAIEEFCSSPDSTSAQISFQLEAALFCLSAVSIEASKRALLTLASPAAQESAAKACKLRNNENIEAKDIAQNSKLHDDNLGRVLRALQSAPVAALSNPLLLSQMCRFIGKYAKWTSQTHVDDILNIAATLALQSFDRAAMGCQDRADYFNEISPFADAATALRNILSRSPHHFATPDALSTLEKGWKSMYNPSIQDSINISLDDKTALCTGITRVLAVLPPEQWHNSLSSLTNPTIECIDALTKVVTNAGSEVTEDQQISQMIEKIGEEVGVLAIAIRTFNTATSKSSSENKSIESPVLAVLHGVWPYLNLIASNLCYHQEISSSLSELLLVAIALSEKNQDVNLLTKLYEISITMVDSVCKSNQLRSLDPVMDLIGGIINTFGPIADTDVHVVDNGIMNIRKIVEQLTRRSCGAMNAIRSDIQVDVLPAMFSICKCSIQRCPILFMTLNLEADGSQDGQIFVNSVKVAVSSIDQKHNNVARTAMFYLKEVLISSNRMNEKCNKICQDVFAPLCDEIVIKIIHGTCGNFPREVLDPAASLLYLILRNMIAVEAERIVTAATSKDCLRLGDEGRNTIISTLGKCAQGHGNLSLMMDLFDDVWTMHQSEENGSESVAGGDHVKKFAQKYELSK